MLEGCLLHGFCPVTLRTEVFQRRQQLFSFKTVQGGFSRFERYTVSHKNGSDAGKFQRQLPILARTKLFQGAALAVCLDIDKLSFCECHDSMHDFAWIFF